jgi:exopolysaccharide biosynthesis WecB/TagA/CpsF family protein
MSEQNARTGAFNVAGVSVNIDSLPQALSAVIAASKCGRGFCLFTLNLDHCAKLRSNPQFKEAYRQAHYVTADGFPIVLLGRLFGVPVKRTAGSDLLAPLCAQAARHDLPVFLLGPSMDVVERASARLAERAPKLLVRGSYTPGRNFDPESVDADVAIKRIRQSGARLCFIALGAPRQEIFAARCLTELPGTGFVCVGAAFDFLAGTQKRAPLFFRDHGLEWLWRLLSNPRRLAARYLQCAAVFPRLAAESITQVISARMDRT